MLIALTLLVGCTPEPSPEPPADWFADDLVPSGLSDDWVVHDLGEQVVTNGVTAPLTVVLSPEATALHVVVAGLPDTVTFLGSATAPDGTSLVTFDPADIPTAEELTWFGPLATVRRSPSQVVPRLSHGSWLVPNTPDISVPLPGTWTLQVESWWVQDDTATAVPVDDSVVRVFAVERVTPVPSTGTVDVTLHLSGSHGYTAANALTEPAIASALATWDDAFRPAGLQLGDIKAVDLNAEALAALPNETLTLAGPTCLRSDTLDTLLASLEPEPGRLNIVFLDRFSCLRSLVDIGAGLGGVSAGFPGQPSGQHDAMLLATWPVDDYPQDWAKVFAHESGHFLGLAHPQEPLPSLEDNLSDTPPGDTDNLMHPNASASPASMALTAQQAWVVRRHPLVLAP